MQRPEINTPQRRMIEKDKEIIMQSVINDEDFKFYENFNYFKRQFESFDHFQQIFKENFFDYELLKAALVRGHESIISYLINDCGCRVSNPNKINLEETPVHLSMNLQNLSIFETILKKDASIYEKNVNGVTLLHEAFKNEEDNIVTIILNYISSCNSSVTPDNEVDVHHFHIACISKHISSIQLYLSFGFDINSHISVDLIECPGLTPLLYLLRHEYDYSTLFEVIQVFIMNGVDVNCSIPLNSAILEIAGFTPLHFAVQEDSVELVELLLKNGADWTRADINGKTPLHLACEKYADKSCIKIIEIFSNCSGSLVAADKFGRTPIHSQFNNSLIPLYRTNILNMLISKPLKNNLTDDDGISFFHIACTLNRPDVVDDFLNSGVKIDICVSDGKFKGYTALHFAVYFNQKDVVELLLKRNAPVNVKTRKLNTPLHLACAITPFTLSEVTESDEQRGVSNRSSQLDIIKLLLLHGADVKATNAVDFTPLFHACSVDRNSRGDVLKYLSTKEGNWRFTETFKILLSNKADIECSNDNQLSIFHVICNNLQEISNELMEIFITAGADINAGDKDGLTPLHYAVIRSKDELVKSFLKYKANVDVKCEMLKTPLQYAFSLFKNCRNKLSLTNCIDALLENGSDVNVRSESGRTFLHDAVSAVSFPRYSLVKKLLYYGIDVNAEDSLGNSVVCSLRPTDTETSVEVLCDLFVHVQKLLALGCYVSEKLQKYCIYLQEYCKTELPNTNYPRIIDNAFDDCINELNMLKNRQISNYTSLYDFLVKDPHELSKYVQNTIVIDIFEGENIDEEFPLYSYLLKLQYKKSLLRGDVLKFAKEALKYATSSDLPDLCYDSVLRYLTNEEIDNLKAAVRVKESCSIKRKLNDISLSDTEETNKLKKQD